MRFRTPLRLTLALFGATTVLDAAHAQFGQSGNGPGGFQRPGGMPAQPGNPGNIGPGGFPRPGGIPTQPGINGPGGSWPGGRPTQPGNNGPGDFQWPGGMPTQPGNNGPAGFPGQPGQPRNGPGGFQPPGGFSHLPDGPGGFQPPGGFAGQPDNGRFPGNTFRADIDLTRLPQPPKPPRFEPPPSRPPVPLQWPSAAAVSIIAGIAALVFVTTFALGYLQARMKRL